MRVILDKITSGKFWLAIRVAHFLYLVLLIAFIYSYFTEYLPYKNHQICAESAAKEVKSQDPADAYNLYQQLYNLCMSH